MSIFSRLFKIGEAKANDIIDDLEKPELMLEQAIRDQAKQIGEARKSVQILIATERKTKGLINREEANKSHWELKARTAVKAGKDDLATKALVRSEEHAQQVATLQPQWETQKAAIDKLKVAVRNLEEELETLKRNKDIIVAQSKAAEVKKKIYEAKAKIGKNNTGDLIERMKNKAQNNQYEADAAEEMAEEATGDQLENEFAALEDGDASDAIKAKLAVMKSEV